MGRILDRANLLFSSVLAICVSIALQSAVGGWIHFRFYTPLLLLAVVYVPGALVLGVLIGHLGNFGTVFQRDYSPLLTCAAMAWSAAQIPVLIAAWTAGPLQIILVIAGLAYLYFAALMFFAVRAVFGLENRTAGIVVALSWAPLVGAYFVWAPLSTALGFLASPFFLFYIIYYLGSEFSRLGDTMRSRQNLRRMLEAAAINPHDGDAQTQLGLLHLERHQNGEAARRFQNAIAIDPTETDAQYQLGRLAREQGKLDDALKYVTTALKQDEKHRSSEVHRELGAIYLELGKAEEARRELALYTERREYDPEGLYYYGRALETLGDKASARDAYRRAVEAARTAPRYRHRFTARWSRLSQRQLRKL
jgi:tetratricopeptide (TPR) repeat protein